MALGGWSSTGAMRLPARVDLGPIGLVLVSRKRLVDDIEDRTHARVSEPGRGLGLARHLGQQAGPLGG